MVALPDFAARASFQVKNAGGAPVCAQGNGAQPVMTTVENVAPGGIKKIVVLPMSGRGGTASPSPPRRADVRHRCRPGRGTGVVRWGAVPALRDPVGRRAPLNRCRPSTRACGGGMDVTPRRPRPRMPWSSTTARGRGGQSPWRCWRCWRCRQRPRARRHGRHRLAEFRLPKNLKRRCG